jgi:hypothetical protein
LQQTDLLLIGICHNWTRSVFSNRRANLP